MKNIKGLAFATDGNMKRMAVTYDEIDNQGKVINPNVKVNRVVTDKDALEAIATLNAYAETIIEEG